MPYDFKLTAIIPASPQEIYDAWLDSLAHSEMTGSEAILSDEIGAEVSAWDGYITGRNIELLPGERIVQSWRTTEFADEHEDSIITLTLEDVDWVGPRSLSCTAMCRRSRRATKQGGWQQYYFEPMKAYFAKAKRASGPKKPKKAARKPKPKAKRAMTMEATRGQTPKTRRPARRSQRQQLPRKTSRNERDSKAETRPRHHATQVVPAQVTLVARLRPRGLKKTRSHAQWGQLGLTIRCDNERSSRMPPSSGTTSACRTPQIAKK